MITLLSCGWQSGLILSRSCLDLLILQAQISTQAILHVVQLLHIKQRFQDE